jgi:penicillin-binding protein 1C
VAPLAVAATLAGEDHRFFSHPGVDARAVARALALAVRHGRAVSGASTITMQLARTLQPHPRSAWGKLGEVVTALRIERAQSKHQVLEQYLNRVYYGGGAYGIEAAARRFFGKPAATLSPGEATLLAVLPRAPLAYDPRHNLPAALERRARVLALLEARGGLDAATRARIEAQPIVLAAAAGPDPRAPHFTDWALAQVPAAARAAGGTVRTTLDLALQRRLERAVALHLEARRRVGLAQAGVVVIEPATGAVRALVGSADYGERTAGQLNITTTLRHPGSALKPFVYALAIEQGDDPASIAHDQLAAVPVYRPARRVRERGPARYREALAGSFNVAAIDVLARVGVAPLLERLRLAGLGPLAGGSGDYGLELALGSGQVRLVDLAAAYGFLVEGGRVAPARLFEDAPAGERRQLFDARASWLVMDMLADPDARRASFGAELPLDLPFPVAAKTGTSSGFADTFAIAATREVVVAAWAGAFDGSGTRGHLAMWSAAPLARAGLLAAAELAGAPLTLPPPPPGLVTAEVCRLTGRAPGPACPRKLEHLPAGQPPRAPCAGHAHAMTAMAENEDEGEGKDEGKDKH